MGFGRRRQQVTRDPVYWHLDFMPALAAAVRPALYMELGVRDADLFNRVVPLVDRAIGVDLDAACAGKIRSSDKVTFVCSSTEDYAALLRQHPITIDMLFIDADHSSDAVLRDFRDYFPFVRPHGLILMHDTHPGDSSLIDPLLCGDAFRAIEVLGSATQEYELITIPVSPGLTICRKRKGQLSWQDRTP